MVTPRMTPHKTVVIHQTTVAYISFFRFQTVFSNAQSFLRGATPCIVSPKTYYPTNVQTIAYNISSTSALTTSPQLTSLGMFSSHSPGCCPQPQDSSSRLTGLFPSKPYPGMNKTLTVVTPRMPLHKAVVIHRTTVA